MANSYIWIFQIAKSCTSLIYLDITDCFDVTTKGLLPVIQHCTQMKCLMLINCRKVSSRNLLKSPENSLIIFYEKIMECLYIIRMKSNQIKNIYCEMTLKQQLLVKEIHNN